MPPLQGASFLSTPLQGGILKPPAERVVVDLAAMDLTLLIHPDNVKDPLCDVDP